MTDDEERQLRQELLAVTLSLKRKQEFWETPRNIAILVGLTALIAGAIGFWLGHESPSSLPAPHVSPAADGSFDRMRAGEFIDAVQTAGIIVIAAALVYVVVRLDRTLTAAAEKMQGAFGDIMKTQSQLSQNVRRVWERIDLIESKYNTKPKDNDEH